MPQQNQSLVVLFSLLCCGAVLNAAAALPEHNDGSNTFPGRPGRSGFTPDVELREKIGQQLRNRSGPSSRQEVAAIPAFFDSRKAWPNCVHPIRNQGGCNSCWAFSTSESISDRFCIATNGSIDVVLSPQELVDCNVIGLENCKRGGDPVTAMVYTSTHGLASDSCYPYTGGSNHTGGQCRKTCANGKALGVLHKTKLASLRWHFSVPDMQRAIMSGGPIVSCFFIYNDLSHSYDGRIYSHGANATMEGGHCVKVVGWGNGASSNGGQEYWIIANSWGQHWGPLGGYFLMARGTNEGNIEREAFSIEPDV